MGGKLSVHNDRIDDFQITIISIYTPGQGICLERLIPRENKTFRFTNGLAYGSWYDIQVIGRPRVDTATTDDGILRYLRKGIYLNCGKTVKISELTSAEHLDLGAAWTCGSCHKPNVGSLAMCEHCFTNKSQTIINTLSYLPVIGLPFSVTNAVFQCGRASQSNTTADNVDAGLTVASAVLDIATAPFIIGSLVKIPAKVAAETGIKLTAKTVFCDAGKPLLVAVGKELGKGGIVATAKIGKAAVEKAIRNLESEK